MPKDEFYELPSSAWTWLPQMGQVFDVGGGLRSDVAFHTVGTFPTIYSLKGNKIAICVPEPDIPTHQSDKISRVDFAFIGATVGTADPFPWEPVPQRYNFYEQYTPDGVLDVTGGKRVIYENMYPLIDLHLYSNKWGPKLYIVIRPGGDPTDIKIEWSGHDSLKIDLQGYLDVWFDNKFIKLTQGLAYQQEDDEIIEVVWQANYNISNDQIHTGFQFGEYDTDLPLILVVRPFDPDQLPLGPGPEPPEWCSFLAGAHDDAMNGLAHDADGFVYVTGHSRSTSGLPIFPGVFQDENLGMSDVVVGRFNEFYEIETSETWMTYLGGSDTDFGSSVVYDPVNDRLVVAGGLHSDITTLPNIVHPANPNSYQRLPDGHSGFVAFIDKVNGYPLYLTRVPGQADLFDDVDTDVDAAGNTYVVGAGVLVSGVGYEQTINPTGAYVQGLTPETGIFLNSGYVLRLTSDADLTWFTRMGGRGDEFVSACKVDRANDHLYVVGSTLSTNDPNYVYDCDPLASQHEFPLCDAGGYFQTGLSGVINHPLREDGFIMRFKLQTAPLLNWSSYFGGAWHEGITDVAVDSQGRVYITGYSSTHFYNQQLACAASNSESGFPACESGDQYFEPVSTEDPRKQFIARFDPNTELSWSTKIGDNSPFGSGTSHCKLAIDPSDNVYVFGSTVYLTAGHTAPLDIENEPTFFFDAEHGDNVAGGLADTYLGMFSPDAELLYGSYLGGIGSDYAHAIIALEDRVYICGTTFSLLNFPTHAPDIQGHTPYLNEVPLSVVATGRGDGFIAQLRYDVTIGVREQGSGSSSALVVYPNPATDPMTVVIPEGVSQGALLIHDGLGRLVITESFRNTNRPTLSSTALAPGSYMVTLLHNGVRLGTVRFVRF